MSSSLFIRSCWCEKTVRPPVWIMRQAGRYLPEYTILRKKYDFLTMCCTPEIATQITLQPLKKFQMDAAILFSDILLIPQVMGRKLILKNGSPPFFDNPIKTDSDIDSLSFGGISEKLSFVYKTIKMCKNDLEDTPLIGFAGAPFTVCSYLLEQESSKVFHKIRKMTFENPRALHCILEKLSSATTEHLNEQIASGVDALQIFESWGHLLTFENFKNFSVHYISQIIEGLKMPKKIIPIILFTRSHPFFLKELLKAHPQVISIDWSIAFSEIQKHIPHTFSLQGNFDPYLLYSNQEKIEKTVLKTLHFMRNRAGYIVNLGHGILPDTPVESVQTFVNTVKNFRNAEELCLI